MVVPVQKIYNLSAVKAMIKKYQAVDKFQFKCYNIRNVIMKGIY